VRTLLSINPFLRDTSVLRKAFITYIRPLLEYTCT